MGTSITIVVDNKTGGGLLSEHGLSQWIETGGRRILFDTGQGPALETNVQALGIDLTRADVLALSHGHYDHTGGIPYVARWAPEIDVYCHPGVVQPRYVIRDGKTRSIGMPEGARQTLDAVPSERIHWVKEPAMLSETVGLTGPVPRLTGYEDTGGAFYLDPECTRPDLIEDDQALWIQTNQGLIVLLGCAHAGVVNTLRYIRALTGDTRVRAVIGGFHLLNAGLERLDRTILALKEVAPDLLVPCHCTGDAAITVLCDALGERVAPGKAGTTYRF